MISEIPATTKEYWVGRKKMARKKVQPADMMQENMEGMAGVADPKEQEMQAMLENAKGQGKKLRRQGHKSRVRKDRGRHGADLRKTG